MFSLLNLRLQSESGAPHHEHSFQTAFTPGLCQSSARFDLVGWIVVWCQPDIRTELKDMSSAVWRSWVKEWWGGNRPLTHTHTHAPTEGPFEFATNTPPPWMDGNMLSSRRCTASIWRQLASFPASLPALWLAASLCFFMLLTTDNHQRNHSVGCLIYLGIDGVHLFIFNGFIHFFAECAHFNFSLSFLYSKDQKLAGYIRIQNEFFHTSVQYSADLYIFCTCTLYICISIICVIPIFYLHVFFLDTIFYCDNYGTKIVVLSSQVFL